MEIIGKAPMIIGAHKENVRERDLLSRQKYKQVKAYDREQLSGWVKGIYRKAFESGLEVGKAQAAAAAEKKRLAAEKARGASEDKRYQPFTVWGIAEDTGTPLDGMRLLYTLRNWDDYETFHLSGSAKDDKAGDEAIMKTMHDADESYADMPLEDFRKIWDAGDYDPPGAYTVDVSKVRITEVVSMEAYVDREPKDGEKSEEDNDAAATAAEAE